ncbi:MAG: indole-3-glycerol phosphate synthase TrpC [Deltaproteobacteria bacterium]|nr:indole-3-glycerol phosphate synthase TrpC [Deltaproteobacteria bacterium]
MSRLDEIIANKRRELEDKKNLCPVKMLESSIYCRRHALSLKGNLQRGDGVGLIAEIKRKSPSRGVINSAVSVEDLSVGYVRAGASALSVLTDNVYFGGKNEDLARARQLNEIPILRKDFIVDEYQVIEAKSIGADAVLLIAAVLAPDEIKSLSSFARQLGLEVLLEVHSEEELSRSLCDTIDIVGINNRDLRDFSVNVETSFKIFHSVPKSVLAISESGIESAETAKRLRDAGFRGFLIGERFMKEPRPEVACAVFVEELKRLLEGDASG